MSEVIDLGTNRPTPEQMRLYAESQAHRILQIHGIPAYERSITAYFRPTARTNLEAVAHWAYEYLSGMENLRIHMLRGPGMGIPNRLDLEFEDRLDEVRSANPFGC